MLVFICFKCRKVVFFIDIKLKIILKLIDKLDKDYYEVINKLCGVLEFIIV